jgi:hypothetical protein
VEVDRTGSSGEVQLLEGHSDMTRPLQHPPGLSVTRRLTTPSGIADRVGRERAEHHPGAAEGDDTVVDVLTVAEGPPGQTLPGADGERPVAATQRRRRRHDRSPPGLPFEDVGEDVAGVPKVLVHL